MKYKYIVEVLVYDGRILHRTIEADRTLCEEGVIKFVKDGGDSWIPIAIYPANKTIITNIQNLK